MAIDPRIAMGIQQVQTQPATQVLDIFQNNLNQAQNRRANEQAIQQQAALHPFREAILGQQAEAGQQQAAVNIENRTIRAASEFGNTVKPVLASGNTEQALTMFQGHVDDLRVKGLPTQGAEQIMQQLQAGNSQGVLSAIDAVQQSARDRGLLGVSQKSVNQREFDHLVGIVQNPNSTQVEKDSANRALGNLARAGSSGSERIAASEELGRQVAAQKAEEAQAVSDVKVSEAQALETETQTGRQAIESKQINIDETKFKNSEKRDQVINAKNARRKEADDAILQIDSLLQGDRFSKAFGKVVTTTPELLRPQESIDAIADVDQIKGLITLESRQKLKGQGTITDSEQKILAQSATVLDNPLISDERARKELRKIKRVFEDASDRNQLKRETKDRIEVEAATEAKGEGQIMIDANGNRARVFADGTFEEL